MSEEAVQKIFGREFAEKYKRALSEARKIPKEKLEKAREFAMATIKDSADFRVKYDSYDVILVQAPHDPSKFRPKETKNSNYRTAMIWAGSRSLSSPFISVFCATRDDAEKIVSKPNKLWLLIGKLQEKPYKGDTSYTFTCFGIVDPEALP
jgi:hypothetical protein